MGQEAFNPVFDPLRVRTGRMLPLPFSGKTVTLLPSKFETKSRGIEARPDTLSFGRSKRAFGTTVELDTLAHPETTDVNVKTTIAQTMNHR